LPPHLQRAEGLFDRLAPLAHLRRMLVEPSLYGFENVLMLPSRDPALLWAQRWQALVK
jgi:hypothetical protein